MDDTLFIEIQRLFEMMHRRGLRELSISQPEFSISITSAFTTAETTEAPQPVVYHHAVPVAAPAPVSTPAQAVPPLGYEIVSPLVGTFYRSASPDAPSFVEIGDQVEVGQTLCIVEAMKVFNEIIADRAGTIIAIPVQNGQLVQVGQPLVVLNA